MMTLHTWFGATHALADWLGLLWLAIGSVLFLYGIYRTALWEKGEATWLTGGEAGTEPSSFDWAVSGAMFGMVWPVIAAGWLLYWFWKGFRAYVRLMHEKPI